MAAPTVVQYVQGIDTTYTTSTTLNVSINGTTIGNGLVVFVSTFNNNPTNITVTDGGDTFTQRVTTFDGSFGIRIVTATIGSGGNLTIAAAKSGACAVALSVYEVTLPDGEAPDGTAVTAAGTNTTATAAMNATSVATDLLLCGITTRETGQVTLNSMQSGWTQDQTQSQAGSFLQTASGNNVTSSTGSYTAGWPSITNGSSRNWNVAAIAIKGTAGGGGTKVNIFSGIGGGAARPVMT